MYQDNPGIGGFQKAFDYESTLSLSVSQHISVNHHLHSFIQLQLQFCWDYWGIILHSLFHSAFCCFCVSEQPCRIEQIQRHIC